MRLSSEDRTYWSPAVEWVGKGGGGRACGWPGIGHDRRRNPTDLAGAVKEIDSAAGIAARSFTKPMTSQRG